MIPIDEQKREFAEAIRKLPIEAQMQIFSVLFRPATLFLVRRISAMKKEKELNHVF